ncbi:MAG: hypothetical protein IJV31_12835 [Clostridia bacterium]|nr:hypothetical protein [Clostridia bacterium]MBQ9659612.1 hypothetical protein [Clostridia bacterium]
MQQIEVTQKTIDNIRDIIESDDFIQDLLSYTTEPTEALVIMQILDNGLIQLEKELNND